MKSKIKITQDTIKTVAYVKILQNPKQTNKM